MLHLFIIYVLWQTGSPNNMKNGKPGHQIICKIATQSALHYNPDSQHQIMPLRVMWNLQWDLWKVFKTRILILELPTITAVRATNVEWCFEENWRKFHVVMVTDHTCTSQTLHAEYITIYPQQSFPGGLIQWSEFMGCKILGK